MEEPTVDPDAQSPSPIEKPDLPNGAVEESLLSDLESLRNSYTDLRARSFFMEDTLNELRVRNLQLSRALEEVSEVRDSLQIKLIESEVSAKEQEEANLMGMAELASEIAICKSRVSELIEERSKRKGAILGSLDSIRSARESLHSIGEKISEEKLGKFEEENSDFDDELEVLVSESKLIFELGAAVGLKFSEHEEMRRKEKKELENSIVSLTEENRDIGSLLRIALVEKEAVEKSLNKLRWNVEQQKRGAIMQIAERGLQKVGFGFVMGVIGGESQTDQPGSSSASTKSDGSECEEEVVSLASTVEKIMKNLRLEISDLRKALEESRSENEHLQTLVDKQAQKISDSDSYIKDLEEKENMLANSVEELMEEIKEAGEEVTRWREACEMEVEAGKAAILEREKEVTLLREEFRRTKAALDAANNKLSLKEKLAATAMAAQAAAEATLRLADNRSSEFRERIEELTKQLEEEAERNRRERTGGRRRVRNVCWPWQTFRVTPTTFRASSRSGVRRRMQPDMQALLHFNF